MRFDKKNSLNTDKNSALTARGLSYNVNSSNRRTSMYDQKSEQISKPHIPYRDSKLTHILKDSLGNNSFTHLIITLSPSYLCLTETISTLSFTKNAKAVK